MVLLQCFSPFTACHFHLPRKIYIHTEFGYNLLKHKQTQDLQDSLIEHEGEEEHAEGDKEYEDQDEDKEDGKDDK